MTKVKVLAIALLVFNLSLARSVVAEPLFTTPVHFKSPVTCTTEAGSVVELPPGYYLTENLWLKLDYNTRRLQDVETRLTAENASLKESLSTPKSVATALLSGLVGIAATSAVFSL